MKRRTFLRSSAAALATTSFMRPGSLAALATEAPVDLTRVSIVLPSHATARETTAARVLVEECASRTWLEWKVGAPASGDVVVYLGTRTSWGRLPSHLHGLASSIPAAVDSYLVRTGVNGGSRWIAIAGADERGLLFGVGALLRATAFSRNAAHADTAHLTITTSPRYALRGHQIGYRPKNNTYDGWTVEMWDRYIRELALFGTNIIEIMPPRTDDAADSPHFAISQAKMMVQLSRICDSYGLDVWVWYPAMDKDYGDAMTVNTAVSEWHAVLATLPRVDAIYVPGGDPGHTEPKYLLPLLEKQKKSIATIHPKVQMWVSPQGFDKTWMEQFLAILRQPATQAWLDGVVYGPQSRLSLPEFRKAVPQHYPVRLYPDITHGFSCQYPMPNWDAAFALTQNREAINPRPEGQANILRLQLLHTVGFISYSEGCNDDVNKFLWSLLGWNPDMPFAAALREYSRFFIGPPFETGFAQGLLNLERNWRGKAATNEGIEVTLSGFRDMEAMAPPAVVQNWRWQSALYRAFFDAFVRRRLLDETATVVRARDLLSRVWDLGWAPAPSGGKASTAKPTNGLEILPLLDAAERELSTPFVSAAGAELRARVLELGATLFQSIHIQLAVDRYEGAGVGRGANLDTLDVPITDGPWLRAEIQRIRAIADPAEQVRTIKEVLSRTDPGPGGFYDDLGDIANRPHLLLGEGPIADPEFRHSPEMQFSYPDHLGGKAPIAWKRWVGSLFDAPLQMRYEGLDPARQYRVRIVYGLGAPSFKIRLVANDGIEIHPLQLRPVPIAPFEFSIPSAATADGTLTLSWTREAGLGGNGVGCQVAEVWLMPVSEPATKG